jgi:hypothetical protein
VGRARLMPEACRTRSSCSACGRIRNPAVRAGQPPGKKAGRRLSCTQGRRPDLDPHGSVGSGDQLAWPSEPFRWRRTWARAKH